MSLPPEILDNILSFLQSDTATLKACSESHPILFQLVERHQYTNVTIQDINDFDGFCHALLDHPHVCKYVRTLEIKVGDNEPETSLEAISSVFPKLSMLRRIALTYSGPAYFIESDWQYMLAKFRIAFLECLRLPSLMDVCIRNIVFPLSTLSHCNHLRNLSLRGWYAVSVDSNNPQLPTIDSLTLYQCDVESLIKIVGSIQSFHLSALKFTPDDEFRYHSFEVLRQIVDSCSHSLTSLDVDISCEYSSHYYFDGSNRVIHCEDTIPIPLSVLPHLQNLTIRVQLEYFSINSATKPGFFSAIPAIKKFLKPAPSLRRLTLDLSFVFNAVEEDDRHRMIDVLCSSLHSLLVQSISVIGSIDIQINSIEGSDCPDVIPSLFTGHLNLMKFVEDGVLTLTPVVAHAL